MVVGIDADAVSDVQRLVARIDGSAGITFLVGIVPERLVPLKLKVELPGLHLGLLQTEEVGIQLTEDVAESFSFTGPQAIHVPGDKLHTALELCHFDGDDCTLIAFIT